MNAVAREAISKVLQMSLPEYSERFLRIRTKTRGIQPLRLNVGQLFIHRKAELQMERRGYVRIAKPKARQYGGSTYVQARCYSKIARGAKGVRAFILTHHSEATANLFAMTHRFHKQLDSRLRPTADLSRKRLYFPRLDSSYAVATAGSKAIGRSDTIQFFHACLSPDTIVLTPDGVPRQMRDLAIGDLVRTHTGVVAPISFISRKKAKKTISIKVMGSSEPIVATPEHKFWTRYGMKRLDELSVGDQIGYPVTTLGNERISWKYRIDYGRRPGRGGVGSVGPDRLPASFELGRVLGLYLAEGCLRKQTKSAGGALSDVTFSVHERETERTLQWLAPFRHCWRSEPSVASHKNSKTVAITVYSRSFAEFVDARCGELEGKKLPMEWRASKSFAHGLVVGYFSGDGGGTFNGSTRRIQAPSIRGAISFGMRDALASLGYGWATVAYRKGAVRSGRNERAQWTIRLSGPGSDVLWEEMGRERLPRTRKQRGVNMQIEGGYAWLPITAIAAAGERDVMDLEVDHPDHSYCIWQGASSNSEMAFWPDAEEHLAGALQAVPSQGLGTEIWLESTGNGISNAFCTACMNARAGISDFELVFVPWLWFDEYRAPVRDLELSADDEQYAELWGLDEDQMQFRQNKIIEFGGGDAGRIKFQIEYPALIDDCFASNVAGGYIEAKYVVMARNLQPWQVVARGPRIMGIDPSYTGTDRFVVFMRQGRVAWRVGRWTGLTTTQSLPRIIKLIEEEKPDIVCIDLGGTPGGGIYDQVVAYCERKPHIMVVPVMGGERADDPERWRNKMSENWGRLKAWLESVSRPCIIDRVACSPGDEEKGPEEIQGDLTSSLMDWDSKGRPVVEMKKRLLTHAPSRDNGDSLANTFTLVTGDEWKPPSEDSVEREKPNPWIGA